MSNMSKLAVIKTGGKQYFVKEGDILRVEKLSGKNDSPVEFEALLIGDAQGKEVEIGMPVLENKVKAKIVEHGRATKVKVAHYKAKTRYYKVYGHRQPFSQVKIISI